MTIEEALAIVDESLVRGKVIDEAYDYSFWYVCREALERMKEKNNEG